MSETVAARVPGVEPWRWIDVVVIVTLLPFLWKAVVYARLGSFVPLATFVLLAGLVAAGLFRSGSWRRRAIRVWSAAMILWGSARLVVLALIIATDLDEAHLRAQITPAFGVVSLAYMAAGFVLWRQAGPTRRGRLR